MIAQGGTGGHVTAPPGSRPSLGLSSGIPLTEHGDVTDRSRLRVESRKWLLSKALPKVYGDKQSVEGKFTVDWAQVALEAQEKWKKKHGGQDS
jgi:hypothetical protein